MEGQAVQERPVQENPRLTREEALKKLSEKGEGQHEHRFLTTPRGPVFIVEESVEAMKERNVDPRMHKDLLKSLADEKMVEDPGEVMGGYCMVVDDDILFYSGPATSITPAEEADFDKAVDDGERGIYLIDQWLGKEPEK